MGHWSDVRKRARSKRAALLTATGHEAGALLSAESVLRIAEEVTGTMRVPLAPGSPLLYGAEALLYTEAGESIIYYNDGVEPWRALFYQAHEFGHLFLHSDDAVSGDALPACDSTDVDVEASETAMPVGVQRVEGYGPRERREREANVFAREFLLPTDTLRKWYLDARLDAPRIARMVGLPAALVYHQLAYALLAPETADSSLTPAAEGEQKGTLPTELDLSQRQAAEVERGPLLVEAGPGTGKTRTLTARVAHLLKQGVAPSSILALTFSNKAAEEMRSRVAMVAPEAAPLIWMGTFHAFGLELLSKYGTQIGLPEKLGVVDPVDALLAVEHALPDLGLRHYMNLWEPAMYLRDILGAISRAKDEAVGPEQYAQLAYGMLDRATTPEETERAERALEVARVYTFYQGYLHREGLVDFGDLIFRAVSLLREYPEVRDRVRGMYSHVLVDEFQDINRASGLLLREVAGDGQGLWAVGDARQAIYRFRGAAPINMKLFHEDYPGAHIKPLGVNYRSQPAIVKAFSSMAAGMQASIGDEFQPWQSDRPDNGGGVHINVATDERAEAEGLASLIKDCRVRGVPYGDQAVLCRSHTTLARISAILEREGVPVLYLGDLFERPEVRDLLCLLDMAVGGSPAGLLRVGTFPEYSIPRSDVLSVLRMHKELKDKEDGDPEVPLSVADMLSRALESEEISEGGRAGLALLAVHLEHASAGRSAWQVLARYLFGPGDYLRALLADGSAAGQQKRLAVFQLLQFAHEQRERFAGDGDERGYFLNYVRRLEIFGEERALRQVPDWADGVDAVRMLTVHASKGLEFRAVYLPGLGNGYFPARRGSEPCPPPHGLLPGDEEDWHNEEEECLFFVALSRARDLLYLSRACRYGRRNSNPSPLLRKVADALSCEADHPPDWLSKSTDSEQVGPPAPEEKKSYLSRKLEVYMECPRQYYYEYVLELGVDEEAAAYVRFHRSVYGAIAFVRGAEEAGQPLSVEEAFSKLTELWQDAEMPGHIHEKIYREQAEEMVRRAVERRLRAGGSWLRPRWEVPLLYGRVRFVPDQVEAGRTEEGVEYVRLQRLRTGRVSSSEKDEPLYALYNQAAEAAYPAARREVQAFYLSSDQAVDIVLNEKQIKSGLDKYDKAMLGIGAGDFHAAPNDRRCPRCAHYFICPAGGESAED